MIASMAEGGTSRMAVVLPQGALSPQERRGQDPALQAALAMIEGSTSMRVHVVVSHSVESCTALRFHASMTIAERALGAQATDDRFSGAM